MLRVTLAFLLSLPLLAQRTDVISKAASPDAAFAEAEKMLKVDEKDAEAAHAALKVAEATKNPDLIQKWAGLTSQAAAKAAAVPKPAIEADAAAWKAGVDYATQVGQYADYSLMAASVTTADPAKKMQLIGALEQQNPQSEYLLQAYQGAYVAFTQAKQGTEAAAIAERAIARDRAAEEMYVGAADFYLKQNKEPAKVIDYSTRLLALVEKKPKPEGMADADFEKRKTVFLSLGNWMAGTTYGSQEKWTECDRHLRAALPLLTDDQLKAAALFYLGLANYRLGVPGKDKPKLGEALKFTQQCAAIKSPYQARAQANIAAIQKAAR